LANINHKKAAFSKKNIYILTHSKIQQIAASFEFKLG